MAPVLEEEVTAAFDLRPDLTDLRTQTPPSPLLTKLPAGAGVGVTNGAARPLWCGDLLTAAQQFALDVLAERHAALAHADTAGLRPPQLALLARLSVHGAAASRLRIHGWKTDRNRSPWQQEQKLRPASKRPQRSPQRQKPQERKSKGSSRGGSPHYVVAYFRINHRRLQVLPAAQEPHPRSPLRTFLTWPWSSELLLIPDLRLLHLSQANVPPPGVFGPGETRWVLESGPAQLQSKRGALGSWAWSSGSKPDSNYWCGSSSPRLEPRS